MKIIGMVGGTGWVSSVEYYSLINSITNEKLGGLNAAKIILYSVNYGEIDAFNRQNNNAGVLNIVLNAAEKLKKAGAEAIILCANTMHQFASQIQKATSLPLIHIGEETAKIILTRNINKVGLLGTKFTMEMDFYHSTLKEHGISSIIPDKNDRIFIHDTIMNELLVNNFRKESKSRFINIIKKLQYRGAEGIILGCTEIPLLINKNDCEIPLFNTTNIHARAAVEFALS